MVLKFCSWWLDLDYKGYGKEILYRVKKEIRIYFQT